MNAEAAGAAASAAVPASVARNFTDALLLALSCEGQGLPLLCIVALSALLLFAQALVLAPHGEALLRTHGHLLALGCRHHHLGVHAVAARALVVRVVWRMGCVGPTAALTRRPWPRWASRADAACHAG